MSTNDPLRWNKNDEIAHDSDFLNDAREGMSKISEKEYLKAVDEINRDLERLINKKKKNSYSKNKRSPIIVKNNILIICIVFLLIISILAIFKFI